MLYIVILCFEQVMFADLVIFSIRCFQFRSFVVVIPMYVSLVFQSLECCHFPACNCIFNVGSNLARLFRSVCDFCDSAWLPILR